jgi:hypothetical protein
MANINFRQYGFLLADRLRISGKANYFKLLILAACFVVAIPLAAQQNTGSIRGVVQDSQGGVLLSAVVSLENQSQGAAAGETTTNKEGSFIFNGLYPSMYTLRVTAPGFKNYEQKDIVLRINDNLGLPPIILELGEITETVTVEAARQQIDTVTAVRSGAVTESQLTDIGLQSRSYTDLLKTVPGVQSDASWYWSVNGLRGDALSYSVDGVSVMDTGANSNAGFRLNVDAIGEFKVTTNSQSAEFGRSSGASISVVTRAGTNEYHGTAYAFKRGEWMDAQTFTNNYYNIRLPLNRIFIGGYTLGGPIYIPKIFNEDKDKLFIFFSHEWNRTKSTTTQQLRLPTEAERRGDFSASRDPFSGLPVTVKDPITGMPFSDNIIPEDRWNEWGAKILNYYPMPNLTSSTDPGYNDRRQYDSSSPIFDQTYRVDYNINQNHRVFVRYFRNRTDSSSPCGGLNTSNNICLTNFRRINGAWSLSTSLISVFSPTLTNEFLYGNSRNYLPVPAPPGDSPYYRSVSGLNIPLLYPDADPIQLIPNLTYGLGFYSPQTNFIGVPYVNRNPVINISDNITKIYGKHTIKAGFFFEKALKEQSIAAPVNATIDFSVDANNPGDANFPFANALLGNFKSYTQASHYYVNDYRYKNIEWYLEDTWKALPNLSLNFGMRFSVMPPMYEDHNRLASFQPSLYDPSKAVVLYQPTLEGGVRKALNPLTNEILPSTFIGKVVPGSGDINNGMVVAGTNGYSRGLADSRGLHYSPRLGIAWQPWGIDSKTVVRAGFGIFYERIQGNMTFFAANNPPIVRNSNILYENLSNYVSAGLTDSPVSAYGISKDGHLPTVYNYNLSIQRRLPWQMLLDVGYVGSVSRHQVTLHPFNYVPFGSAWLPENQDPTLTPNLDGSSTLPVDLYRPYLGYVGTPFAGSFMNFGAGGWIYAFDGNANYNSLQVSLQRRMSKDLQFGASYTFGKALGISDNAYLDGVHPTNVREANYGPLGFDRRHSLIIDFIYNLPNLTDKIDFLKNPILDQVFGGWEVSGIATFATGAPGDITYSISGIYSQALLNRLTTGSEDVAPRVVYSCNPKALDDASLTKYVDDSCIHPAPKGSIGIDSGTNSVYGPGTNNWDLSVFKKFFYWKDHPERYLQLRLEMYNAFNHTQWSNFNRSATIDATTGEIVNLPTDRGGTGGRFGFGALNSNRPARSLQLAAKIYF